MMSAVVDKRVLGLTALFIIFGVAFHAWSVPPAPSEIVQLGSCAIPRGDVEYVSDKVARVRVRNDVGGSGEAASTMLFIRPQADMSSSTAAVRSANIVDLAPINSEYDISAEPDFPGFTLYQERYGNQNKYYVKDTAPRVVISVDPDLGMRVFREVPPAIEVNYVVRRNDVPRLREVGENVDRYVNAYCRNSVVS